MLMQYFGLSEKPERLPDTDYTGYDFWLSKLDNFNGNYVNAEMVRPLLPRQSTASDSETKCVGGPHHGDGPLESAVGRV